MKSKIFVFTTLILVVFLFVITSCDNFLNAKNKTTININLDLSKILKTSRNETTTIPTEYILKVFAYNAFSYRNGSEIENLPLITKIENKVNANGIVKVTMNIEVGVNVIFGAKLYEVVNNKISENPTYIGHSDIVKIKAVDNNVNLVFTKNEVHQHTFATEWSFDETEHWHEATCEHTTEVSEKAKHTFGDWKVTKDPTEEAEGSKERTCTVCGYTATEVIENLAHTHKFATDWTKDETHHWHATTCEHTTEVSDKAKHTFSDWQVTKEATEEDDGSRERTCTVCGYKATEVIEKLDHTHTFSEDWTSDELYHWHSATCGHTTEVSDKAEHTYTNGVCVCGMREMVLIPAGTFQMGSNDSISTAKPVQDVTITKSFYMGKFEVTQAEYEKYCSYTGSGSPSSRGDGDNYPAYWVNWYDALVYCNKRSITEGLTPCYSISGNTDPSTWGNVPSFNDTNWKSVVCDWEANGYRLPTEAEWEYAARAGDNISSYAWSGTSNRDELVDYAWFIDNSNDKIHEVGTKKANSFGLYDMSGNVEEWCWNWYTSSYSAGTEGGSDPTGASSGTNRVTRGGCWRSYAGNIYVNFRNYNAALNHVETCGFRVVRLAEVHEHTFSGWQVTKEASCTENGERKATCIVCGYEKTEITDKTEHSFAYGICVCGLPKGFVLVEAGTFQMGSEVGMNRNKPVHQVTITKDFYMGKYEVTQAEYEKYCSYTGSYSPSSTYGDGDNYPAYYVRWYNALVYCNKRSMAEGLTPCYSISGNTDPSKWGTVPTSSDSTWDAAQCDWNANGYRLPTEAEWEYAARAGDNTVSSLTWAGTNSSSKLGEYAWYESNSDNINHEVGKKLPNAYGLYDMSGNVWEWCWNWFTDSYDTETEGGSDPTGTSAGSNRVFRGGSWYHNSDYCAVSFRNDQDPSYRSNTLGFRVVRSATE